VVVKIPFRIRFHAIGATGSKEDPGLSDLGELFEFDWRVVRGYSNVNDLAAPD
jgi:hypothetical protein